MHALGLSLFVGALLSAYVWLHYIDTKTTLFNLLFGLAVGIVFLLGFLCVEIER